MAKGRNSYIRKDLENMLRGIITSTKTCMYCKMVADELHIDHILPPSLGGDSMEGNLTIACKRCNSSKSNSTIGHWFESIKSKIDYCVLENEKLNNKILKLLPTSDEYNTVRSYAGRVSKNTHDINYYIEIYLSIKNETYKLWLKTQQY